MNSIWKTMTWQEVSKQERWKQNIKYAVHNFLKSENNDSAIIRPWFSNDETIALKPAFKLIFKVSLQILYKQTAVTDHRIESQVTVSDFKKIM